MGGGEKSGSPYEGNMWTLTNGNTTVEGHNSREADTRVWMRVIISAHLFKKKYIAMILSDVLCVGQLKQYLLQPCQPFEIIWDQLWWDFMFWNNENLTHHHRHIIDSFSLWAECWMEPIAAFPGRHQWPHLRSYLSSQLTNLWRKEAVILLSLAIPPSVSLVETGLMINNIQEGKPARIILKLIAEQNLKSLQPSVLCSGKERGDGGG